MESLNQERYTWVDAMKGIAICGVVMIHSGGASLPSILGILGDAGKYGVQLFFLLSGFLAYVSLHNFYNGQHSRILFVWWAKKIVKLLPLYYLAIIVALLVEGTGGRYWLGSCEKVTFLNVLAHFLLLHGLNPYYVNSIIGGEWYLAVLIAFYVLAPWVYKYINSLKKAEILFIVSVIISYCLNNCMVNKVPIADEYIWREFIKVFWLPTQFPVLVLGIVLYFLLYGEKEIIVKICKNRLLSYAILVFAVFVTIGQLYEINPVFKVSRFVTWALCFFVVIISQVLTKCIIIDNIVFRSIGKLSYPIYLFHFRLITIFERYIQKDNEYNIYMWLMKYLGVMLGSYLIAYLLEKKINIPLIKYLEKRVLAEKK